MVRKYASVSLFMIEMVRSQVTFWGFRDMSIIKDNVTEPLNFVPWLLLVKYLNVQGFKIEDLYKLYFQQYE